MNDQVFKDIGLKLAEEHNCTIGQMFGKACLKTNNKAFAAFFNGEMVFKLGQEQIILMKKEYPGSVNWDPSGKSRAMEDWLQVPFEFEEQWFDLARKAFNFVH